MPAAPCPPRDTASPLSRLAKKKAKPEFHQDSRSNDQFTETRDDRENATQRYSCAVWTVGPMNRVLHQQTEKKDE